MSTPEDLTKIRLQVNEHRLRIDNMERLMENQNKVIENQNAALDEVTKSLLKLDSRLSEGAHKLDKRVTILFVILILSSTFGETVTSSVARIFV